MEGLVTRALNSFFDVVGSFGVRRCRARGVFKKRGTTVMVGDRVEFDPIGGAEGVIHTVHPRRMAMIRPPIANVDQVLLVFSMKTPDFHPNLLDRVLIQVLDSGAEPCIVLTKCDLASEEEVRLAKEPYQVAGFQVLTVNRNDTIGIEAVLAVLEGKTTVFAGPSGAGKSTLANAIAPILGLKMGEISEKLGRGKHTTRHVELFPVNDKTWVADAPGFSQMDVRVPSDLLRRYYPEFERIAEFCGFRGCLHIDEQDCEVKRSLKLGTLHQVRYDAYRNLYFEIVDREAHQY